MVLPSFDNTEIAFRHKTNKELKKANFLFSSMSSPMLTNIGMKFTQWIIDWKLPLKGVIKKTIFSQFCGGENIQEAAATAAALQPYNVDVALDYGVEGSETEEEFDEAVPEFVKAIQYASTQKNIPFIPIKITGFARFSLLEKIQLGDTLNEEETNEWHRVKNRIETICNAANQHNIMILIDAEESWIQQPVDELANGMMQQFNKGKVVVFNTFQLYRNDRLEFLKDSYNKAVNFRYILGAKLVRGAYMEKERKRASENNYLSPIQSDKTTCDRDYDEAVAFCLSHLDDIAIFIGTHNENSCLRAAELMQKLSIKPNSDHVYFSQLYGMSDNITFNLANAGFNVSKYLPYGPIHDVMPYLMRRAQENTSVAGQTGRELSLIRKEISRRKNMA